MFVIAVYFERAFVLKAEAHLYILFVLSSVGRGSFNSVRGVPQSQYWRTFPCTWGLKGLLEPIRVHPS